MTLIQRLASVFNHISDANPEGTPVHSDSQIATEVRAAANAGYTLCGTCSTCKFWQADPGIYRDTLPKGYGDCGRIDYHDEQYPNRSKDPAQLEVSAADDTNLLGRLRTKADFGCLMHQLKKED